MTAISLIRNLADVSNLSASSERSTARAQNVQDPQRFTVWRSQPGDDPAVLTFTLPIKMSIEYVAIVDTNMGPTGTIRVEAFDAMPKYPAWLVPDMVGAISVDVDLDWEMAQYADAPDAPDAVADITVSPSLFVDPIFGPGIAYGDGSYGDGPYGSSAPDSGTFNDRNITIIRLPAPIEVQYVTITLRDPNVSYHQLARVFIGTAYTYSHGLSQSVRMSRVENSSFARSIGGQRFGQRRASQLSVTGRFGFLDRAERTNQLKEIIRVGQFVPFIFSMYQDGTDAQRTHTLYGHYESPEITNTQADFNDFTFTIVEDL